MLKVQVTNRKTKQTKSYQFTQHAVIFGRQQNCDVMLESSSISRRHAKLTLNKELVEIEDLGSGNGTLVNQIKIPTKEKTPLKPEDNIRIEEYDIKVQLDIDKDSSHERTQPAPNRPPLPSSSSTSPNANSTENTDPDILEIKMIKKVLGALDQEKLPSLTVISEPFKNKKVVFEENIKKLIIGRESGCHLSLDSSVVSRQHAFIALKWGGYVIKDMDSKNGTFVNGERIEEKSLKDGDEIVFGTLKTIFKNPQEFDIESITRSLAEHKKQQNQDEEKIEPKTEAKPLSKSEPVEESEKKPATIQKPKKTGRASLFKQFSPLELALFGFGALVIIVVLVFMVKLLTE